MKVENNEMTEREMLEFAAKAVGYDIAWSDECGCMQFIDKVYDEFGYPRLSWAPLEDDGDALRLAVKLGMNIDVGVNPVGFTATAVIADYNSVFVDEYHEENPMKATRRAIVRAAAEIGKRMA